MSSTIENHNKSDNDTENDLNFNKSGIIELNIGGIHYSTTKTTLLRYEDSMLALMISGDYPTYKDKDGRLFIDRDGSLFSYILNYLRTNKLIINDLNYNDNSNCEYLTLTINKLINLKIEADFYRIDNLINDIDNLLMIQREKLTKALLTNETKNNYYQLQLQQLQQEQQHQQQQRTTASISSSSQNTNNNNDYHLDIIEHNFLNTNTKCLQIIAHYDVFKMLPLMKDDLDLIENAKQTINASQQSQMPHKLPEHHCWYLGNDCFEIQNISYLTRAQIGHILLQLNCKLIHSNIAYLNSINNSTYNLSILDKWFIPKDAIDKHMTSICIQQKALPSGRVVGYIDWDPQNQA